MARRVGFGTPKAKRSVADEYADRFRKRAHDQKATPKLRIKRQWFPIVFLCVWLVLWTAGILFVIGVLFGGSGADTFLLIWLAFAVFGWFGAVKALITLFKGEQVIDE